MAALRSRTAAQPGRGGDNPLLCSLKRHYLHLLTDTFNKRTLGIYCFDIYLTFIFFKLADTIPLGQYCLEL